MFIYFINSLPQSNSFLFYFKPKNRFIMAKYNLNAYLIYCQVMYHLYIFIVCTTKKGIYLDGAIPHKFHFYFKWNQWYALKSRLKETLKKNRKHMGCIIAYVCNFGWMCDLQWPYYYAHVRWLYCVLVHVVVKCVGKIELYET